MKRFNILYHQLLKENTHDIDSDIDYIGEYIEDFIDSYKETPSMYASKTNYIYAHLTSEELPSQIGQIAHKKNPIQIKIGIFSSSFYDPRTRIICISINHYAVEALGSKGLNNSNVIQKYPHIVKEFDVNTLKTTVAHELTHWLDDTLYGKSIKRAVDKFNKQPKTPQNIKKFKTTSTHEINSLVHELKQLKRNFTQNEWDAFTFQDLAQYKPRYGSTFREIKSILSTQDVNNFKKQLYNRLNREGLISKAMKNHDIMNTYLNFA